MACELLWLFGEYWEHITIKQGDLIRGAMEMTNTAHAIDSKRFHDRKKYEKEVVFVHRNRLYSGSLKNISLGGAYIETYCVNQFAPADIVTLNIPFSSGRNNIKRQGRVRWLNNVGFAIEFI